MSTMPVFCGKDCGGNACPLLAVLENGRITRITHNPAAGKYIKGCMRSQYLRMEEYAPDRIVKPLVRTGPCGSGQFRQASWDEALDITATKLGEIRTKYGSQAVMCRGSAGVTSALHCTWALLGRFFTLFGGATMLSGSYSIGAAGFILPYVLGREWTASGFDAATMQFAEMIILWGANVLETRQGAEVPQRLIQAKKRGAQIVVIDPRRSATVKQAATWWIPCRPGTDSALMLAVLYVLLAEDRADRSFIAAHSVGFDQLENYVLGLDGGEARTPQWAERICGVSENEIIRFARAYAEAKPAMLFPGFSIQRVFAGEEPYRLSIALQIATGNFGKRGGSTGSINSMLPAPKIGRLTIPGGSKQPSLPVAHWPDAILQGRSGGYPTDIHAIYNLGCNTINQGSDIRKSIAAFKKLDFAVSHEIFMTPTARHCDVVFPTTTALEKEDIGLPWLGNYLLYKPQVLPPMGQARSDYEALCDLADRLGFLPEFSEGRSAADWVQHFIDQSEIPDPDEFRRTGIYLAPDQERVGLADFTADPEHHRLSTPSGKVELASEKYHRQTGFPAIPTWQRPPEDKRYPLRLITPKSPHFTHSQGSNIPTLRQKAAHALTINPQDAETRGIRDGEIVRLFNARGAARVTARLSEDLTPGVVCLTEGVWVELDIDGVDQAGSANMFTDTQGTAPGAACIMHAVGVEIQPIRPLSPVL